MKIEYIDIEKLREFPLPTRYSRSTKFTNRLAEDIKENGILQPLLVVKEGEKYIVVDGHYRLEASILAGLKKIPCIVLSGENIKDMFIKGITVNIKRKRYNVLDLAHVAKILHDRYNLTYPKIAEMLGISRMHLYRAIYVLDHALEEEKIAYLKGQISFRRLYQIVKQREKDGKVIYLCPVCGKECSAEDSIVIHIHRDCYERMKGVFYGH